MLQVNDNHIVLYFSHVAQVIQMIESQEADCGHQGLYVIAKAFSMRNQGFENEYRAMEVVTPENVHHTRVQNLHVDICKLIWKVGLPPLDLVDNVL